MAGLEFAETASGVTLEANAHLASLSGLDALASVGTEDGQLGSVVIEYNPLLASLVGWNALRQVGGDLMVSDNASLPQADAETWAAQIEVEGSVTLSGNAL